MVFIFEQNFQIRRAVLTFKKGELDKRNIQSNFSHWECSNKYESIRDGTFQNHCNILFLLGGSLKWTKCWTCVRCVDRYSWNSALASAWISCNLWFSFTTWNFSTFQHTIGWGFFTNNYVSIREQPFYRLLHSAQKTEISFQPLPSPRKSLLTSYASSDCKNYFDFRVAPQNALAKYCFVANFKCLIEDFLLTKPWPRYSVNTLAYESLQLTQPFSFFCGLFDQIFAWILKNLSDNVERRNTTEQKGLFQAMRTNEKLFWTSPDLH